MTSVENQQRDSKRSTASGNSWPVNTRPVPRLQGGRPADNGLVVLSVQNGTMVGSLGVAGSASAFRFRPFPLPSVVAAAAAAAATGCLLEQQQHTQRKSIWMGVRVCVSEQRQQRACAYACVYECVRVYELWGGVHVCEQCN